MELTGKKFDIKGEHKEVVNVEDGWAYFADGARVKSDILVTKYQEVMDPNSFFNTKKTGLESIAEDLNKIDTNTLSNDTRAATQVQTVNETQESTIKTVQSAPVANPEVTKIDNTGLGTQNIPGQNDFFSKIKRKNDITINFSITEKFPDLDFVRMMNDNYEMSIIEYFAREIVEKMIYDPEELLNNVKESINEIVYGPEETVEEKEEIKDEQGQTDQEAEGQSDEQESEQEKG